MTFRRARGQPDRSASTRVRKPSSAQRRNAERAAIGEDVSFTFAYFFVVMPVPAVIAGIVAAATGIVTPGDALVSVALTGLLVALHVRSDRVKPVGTSVVYAVVEGVAGLAVALAPVPVLGRIAEVVGRTMVLWVPVAILALVALISPS